MMIAAISRQMTNTERLPNVPSTFRSHPFYHERESQAVSRKTGKEMLSTGEIRRTVDQKAKFPAKLKSYLMEMLSLRNRADYRHESVGRNKALIQPGNEVLGTPFPYGGGPDRNAQMKIDQSGIGIWDIANRHENCERA